MRCRPASLAVLSALLAAIGCRSVPEAASSDRRDATDWRTTTVADLLDAYERADWTSWEHRIAGDASCRWNRTMMTGEELLAAVADAHAVFADISLEDRVIDTTSGPDGRAVTWVAADWSARARSTGVDLEIPCQMRIVWDGPRIVVFDEVFDETPIESALDADGNTIESRLAATAATRASVVERAFESMDLPAAACAMVTRDGRVEFVSLGTIDPDDPRPVDPDSLFDIASMTKLVTTVAALQLVDRGLLGLDDPLEAILPELGDLDIIDGDGGRRSATRPITLRKLLTHTAGFGYFFNSPQIAAELELDPITGWPMPDELQEGEFDWGFGIQPRRVFEAGETWQYGRNVGVAGKLVERLSGQDLDAYFHEHIFEPLGMDRSGYNPEGPLLSERVRIHVRDPETGLPTPAGRFRDDRLETFYGGGNLYSTPRDYARFLRCLLDGGRLDGVRILDASLVAEMTRNQLPEGIRVAMPPMPGAPADRRSFVDEFDDGFGLGHAIETTAAGSRPDGLRPDGVGYWSGIHNTYYTLDPERGLAILFFSQVQPFDDAAAYELYRIWEDEIYRVVLPRDE